MARTAIATDSNSGITQSQAKELGVFVLPMPFFMRGKIQLEDIDLTQEQFYEILAEEPSRRDMDYPEITDDNYDEIVTRMDRYMSEFELSGVDHLVLDEENA